MSSEVNPALDKLMEGHLARMDQIQEQGVAVTKKWSGATAQLVERFIDISDRITPVLLEPPTPEVGETEIA